MLPRRSRKNQFGGRAAVVTAPSAPRIVAGPPSPPTSDSDSGTGTGGGGASGSDSNTSSDGGGASRGGGSGSGGGGASGAGGGSGFGGRGALGAGGGSGFGGRGASGAGGGSGSGGGGASGAGGGSGSGGGGPGAAECRALGEDDFEAADEFAVNGDAGPVINAVLAAAGQVEADTTSGHHIVGGAPLPRRAAADAMAEQLASRRRFLHIFPAACWVPGAQAAIASAPNAAFGRPPLPRATSSVTNRHLEANTISSPQRAFAAPPPPAPLPQQPRSPPPSAANVLDDESSDDMDDDELVLAYVTPPASPVASTMPGTSPLGTRPSSGTRRRSAESRAARGLAAAAAAASQAAEASQQLTLDDIRGVLRSGFSSVGRELTRLRAELVVVKSQSASVLRRMDGMAAAADGRESGNGVVLERLACIDRALNTLGERMAKTSDGEEGGVASVNGRSSVALVTEIKVRALPYSTHCTLTLSPLLAHI